MVEQRDENRIQDIGILKHGWHRYRGWYG